MKRKPLLLIGLAVAAIAAGCDKPDTTSQQLDNIREEAKETAQDMKDYTYAQREEFVATMQRRLDEINRDLDQLAAEVEKSSDAAKAETKPKLQALRDQTARLTSQLAEARSATESTWDSVKAGFKQGYSELENGFNEARQWVSDKIAP
jgi:chromosome segregation ATPase